MLVQISEKAHKYLVVFDTRAPVIDHAQLHVFRVFITVFDANPTLKPIRKFNQRFHVTILKQPVGRFEDFAVSDRMEMA